MRLVYDTTTINEAIDRLAENINKDYEGREPLFIGVLSGAFIFTADLVRRLDISCKVDFVRMESYGNETSPTSRARLTLPTKLEVKDEDVIVVEEIVDTGATLEVLIATLKEAGAKSVAVCALVDKQVRRATNIKADYIGLVCEDGFLVGYGLDHAERLRNLPAIYRMD